MYYYRDVHKSVPVGTNQVLQHVRGIFKESDRIHACPAVATLQHREKWTHRPRVAVVTYIENRNSYDKDSVIPLLIYLEYSNKNEDDPVNP